MSIFNKLVVGTLPILPKSIVAKVAKKYIAGETLQDAVFTVQQLNSHKAMATIDVLGEDITTREEATVFQKENLEVLTAISQSKINSNLSIKLTSLGLKIDKEFCQKNVEEIVALAKHNNNFVRIDMEDHTCTDATLEIYRNVRAKYSNVGIVIQAYLHRSENDILQLANEGANVRLCKGIYNEPPTVALKEREKVQQNYLHLLKILLAKKCYVGIATHDDVLIDGAKRIIMEMKLSPQEYEFQMLLGVRTQRRDELLNEGHRLRIYTPFGKQWYEYSVRRLKENPQIAGYVFKAMFE